MKSRNLLLEDHRQILRALTILEEMAARVDRFQEPDEEDIKDVVEFLNEFGDGHHHGREELVVFPALLRNRGQANYRRLCSLVFEHNRQRSLIKGMADSLVSGKRPDFVYYATHLVDILRNHLKEEDDVLLPLMQSTFSRADDDRVFRDMKAYGQQWQETEYPRLLGRIDELESKYFRKALAAATS